MCSTDDEENYLYKKCDKNGVIGSECVTILKESKIETQGNDMLYTKNPYECVLVNDFEQYDVKSESPGMVNWSILDTNAQYMEFVINTCYHVINFSFPY